MRENIHRGLLLAAVATVALGAPASAQAARFGFADDAGKYADDGGAAYYSDLRSAGGTENRITVLWDPEHPLQIADEGFLDRALPVAAAKGVRVVFHVYPLGPTSVTSKPAAVQGFADFLTKLATAYPDVHEYVVGNEPNQPRFWRPQYSALGRALAAPAYAALLGKSYDALKKLDPALKVIGLWLSGGGNDLPFAPSNASTSPVRFLRDLGVAYPRAGGSWR